MTFATFTLSLLAIAILGLLAGFKLFYMED